jgi:hypothetical protein
MKLTFFTFVLAFMFANAASAQIPEHSVGLRYGAVFGLGTEISYQHGLTSKNRLEMDFGYSSRYEYINGLKQDYNSWALNGLYHWVWKLNDQINLFAGGGAKVGFWSSSQKYDSRYNNGIFLSVVGDTGIEYAFPGGIQLGLDVRPEVGLYNQGAGVNVGFALRYQFKSN